MLTDQLTDAATAEFDQVAAITADPETAAESRIWSGKEQFRVPAEVWNVIRQRDEAVFDLADAG